MVYLTNRFHVAVHLFSNRSQMTSKCDKNKKVAHEAIAECVTDVLILFLFFSFFLCVCLPQLSPCTPDSSSGTRPPTEMGIGSGVA